MTFPDHFSSVAAQYASSRPHYPDALFEYLADLAPARNMAWDAGCGSGQAAIGLAPYFAHVVATDASAQQIANAEPRANIVYSVASETLTPLRDASVDLVTVAQALHWFDRPRFYDEVRRVLVPDGVLAAWTYGLTEVTPDVDAAVLHWYRDALDSYWPPQRLHVESRYRDIDFPFATLDVPSFAMTARWSRPQFIAYLETWSAVQAYKAANGADPIGIVRPALEAAWPDAAEVRLIRWPLTLLAGRRQR
jgi:SAM-dependent methyltransferase